MSSCRFNSLIIWPLVFVGSVILSIMQSTVSLSSARKKSKNSDIMAKLHIYTLTGNEAMQSNKFSIFYRAHLFKWVKEQSSAWLTYLIVYELYLCTTRFPKMINFCYFKAKTSVLILAQINTNFNTQTIKLRNNWPNHLK